MNTTSMQTAFVSYSPLLTSGLKTHQHRHHHTSKRNPLAQPPSQHVTKPQHSFNSTRRCHIVKTCQSSSGLPPPTHDNDEHRLQSGQDAQPTSATHNPTPTPTSTPEDETIMTFSTPEMLEVDEQLTELDHIAESWIGSDIGRWEWYERLRCRRTKMLVHAEKESVKLDEDVEQLRRSLLEIDAALGTSMLDDSHNISPMGWVFLFTLVSLYVSIGYAIVHGIVYGICAYMQVSSFP